MVFFVACLVLLFLGIWVFQSQQMQALAGLGRMVEVVIATRAIQPLTAVTAADVTVMKVPERFAGADHLSSTDQIVGKMMAVAVPKGAHLPRFALYTAPQLRPGERPWELHEGGNVLVDSGLQTGDLVDVLVASAKGGQEVVLQIITRARVLDMRAREKERPLAISLGVSGDESRALMEAENFARQVRVVRRPGGTP